MKLDRQFNVYMAKSEIEEDRGQNLNGENDHSKMLYHRYLEIYEQNQLEGNEFEKMEERLNSKQAIKELKITKNQERKITFDDVLKENKLLKEQLEQALEFIVSLKTELNRCKQELEYLRRISTQNQIQTTSKHQYILQQLQALLQNKSLLDEQVQYLKSQIQNKIQSQQNCSMQFNLPYHSINNSKQKQFVRSIQNMYESIQGIKQQNLILIWRWLKQITMGYTRYMKWRRSNQKRIATACRQPLLALTLLTQLKSTH